MGVALPLRVLPVLVLPVLLLASGANAQQGGCVLYTQDGKLVESEYWDGQFFFITDKLKDTTEPNTIYYTFTNAENINGVKLDETYDKYFKVEILDNNVVIKTGDNFPDYEKDSSNTLPTLHLTILCGNKNESNSISVVVAIEDTNNWKPLFEYDNYELSSTIPVQKGEDLTAAVPVIGWDYDMTSQGVSAAIVGEEAEQWFTATADKTDKEFRVKVLAATEVRTKDPVTFILRVTDKGTQDDTTQLSSDVTVTFTPNVEESVLSPRFAQPLHTAVLHSVEDASPGAALPGEAYTLEEGAEGGSELTLTLSGGGVVEGGGDGTAAAALLEARQEEEAVRLYWAAGADPDSLTALMDAQYALIVLTAAKEGAAQTGSTVVHLVLPGAFKDITTPTPCPATDTTVVCTPCPETTTSEYTSCPEITTTDCTCPETTTTTLCPETTTVGECTPCPATTTSQYTTCPETTTTTECACPNTTSEYTKCPETTTTTQCTCPETTTVEACTPCPATTTSQYTTCPETTTTTECVCSDTTSEYTKCPETTTTTECKCAETTTIEECKPNTTTEQGCTPCPTTTTSEYTTLPENTTQTENFSQTSTPCPDTTTNDFFTSCPPCVCSTTNIVSSSEAPSTECPSTECPCQDPSTKPTLVELEFEKASYVGYLQSDSQKGTLVATPALKNADAAPSDVTFALEKGSSSAPLAMLNVDASTGVVTLAVEPPLPGSFLYRITAHATGASPAAAELLVLGPSVVLGCADGSRCFSLALDVQHTNEHAERLVLAPAGDTGAGAGCTFTLLDGKDYFSVDESTGAATVLSLDREAEEFGGAEAPVLRLELGMNCDDDSPATVARGRSASDSWESALENVSNEGSTTVLLVVLDDINDNAPYFPATIAAGVVVGVPDAALAQRLRSAALYTAQALDADVGENAALRYSVDGAGAKYVRVHETSGALYPRRDAPPPADGVSLRVGATDRRGRPDDEGTYTAYLPVTLRALSARHLVEVRAEKALPEEAEALLAEAEAEAGGLQLRALSTSLLPGDGDRAAPLGLPHLLRARRAAPAASDAAGRDDDDDSDEGDDDGEGTELRIVVYALRDGAPEDADDFKGTLKSALKAAGFEAEADKAQLPGDGGGDGGGDEGLLAAVITLATLLGVALLGAAFLGYWYGLRPRLADRQPRRLPKEDPLADSSLHSVAATIEPLSMDMLKVPLDAGEAAAPRPLVLGGEGGGSEGGGGRSGDGASDETTDDGGYEEPQPAPPRTYETLLPPFTPPAPPLYDSAESNADSDASQAPRRVVFNEDVDCIEIIRM